MCSMSLTVVVSARSNGVTMRPDIWSGGKPVYCQTTPITGMRISGKMSVGVRSAASGPMIRSSSASTTKVYGRLSAIRTSAIISQVFPGPARRRGLAFQDGQFIRGLIYPNPGKKANGPGYRRLSLPRHPSIERAAEGAARYPPDTARKWPLSGCPDIGEELADLELETVAVAGQRLGCRQHLGRSRSGLGSAALHVGDVGGHLLGTLGGLLHVAGDFLGRGALLFHRCCDGRGDLRQPLDGAADLLDGADRILRRGLDAGNLLADFAGGLRRLFRQRLNLRGDHRKAAAGFPGARSFDGGVER